MRRSLPLAVLLFALGVALGAPARGAADNDDPRMLLRSAETQQQAGHRSLALAQLERARELAEALGDRALLAAVRGSLGKAYLLTGRRDEARAQLALALEAASSAGNPVLAAAVLNDMG